MDRLGLCCGVRGMGRITYDDSLDGSSLILTSSRAVLGNAEIQIKTFVLLFNVKCLMVADQKKDFWNLYRLN